MGLGNVLTQVSQLLFNATIFDVIFIQLHDRKYLVFCFTFTSVYLEMNKQNLIKTHVFGFLYNLFFFSIQIIIFISIKCFPLQQ